MAPRIRGTLIAGLAVLGCLGLVPLAGCGGGGAAPFPSGEAATAGGGGRLSYAIASGPGSLDPLHARTFSARMVARQLFEPLVERLRGPYSAGKPDRPGLALAWSHSRDLRIWSFRLRPEVRFGDGTPLDATAVVANAERWRSDPGGRQLLPGLIAADAPRPNVARLILSDPLPGLPRRLADPRLGIVSPPALAPESGVGARFVGAREAGSGPFELRGRVASVTVLDRRRAWWGSPLGLGPALDEVIFRVVPNPAVRDRLLRAGSVRVAAGFDTRRAAEIAADPLLTATGRPGDQWVAFERSVRGIADASPIPLSGVWTALLPGSG